MNISRCDNSNMIWLVILGFLVLVVVFIFLNKYYEKKRKEALRQIALRLGLEFSAQTDNTLLYSLTGFYLFSQGHENSKKIFNVLAGNPRNVDMAIFDYKYVTGSGKNRHNWTQTVTCFTLNQRIFPSFTLRPENLWHKIGSWFGKKDINFESHPEFSKRYLLKGSDEGAVRKLFSSRIITYFEKDINLCAEGEGEYLILYHQNERVKPELIPAFMEEGYKILAMFQESAAFV